MVTYITEIEALHVTLQELQLSWYERIRPGLNGAFLIGMLLLVLLFFIIKKPRKQYQQLFWENMYMICFKILWQELDNISSLYAKNYHTCCISIV